MTDISAGNRAGAGPSGINGPYRELECFSAPWDIESIKIPFGALLCT